MAAMSAIRFNKSLSEYYQRLTESGKKKMVAITAVMRKMVLQLNAILRDGFILEYQQ
jgi:transposase